MNSIWISLPVLFIINLGFAGLLGTQIYHLRAKGEDRLAAAQNLLLALALGGLVWLPQFSLPNLAQWFGWLAAVLVVGLFAARPKPLPRQLWTLRFAFRYAALAMLLVALWGLLPAITAPLILLSPAAVCAGALAWLRSGRQSPAGYPPK